jgi:hypothetical protein
MTQHSVQACSADCLPVPRLAFRCCRPSAERVARIDQSGDTPHYFMSDAVLVVGAEAP